MERQPSMYSYLLRYPKILTEPFLLFYEVKHEKSIFFQHYECVEPKRWSKIFSSKDLATLPYPCTERQDGLAG